MTAEVQGNYPNFKQNLLEEKFGISKVIMRKICLLHGYLPNFFDEFCKIRLNFKSDK